jgi:hypothetical protein
MCDLVCDPPDHHYLFSRDVSFLLLWHHVPPSSTSPTALTMPATLPHPSIFDPTTPPPPSTKPLQPCCTCSYSPLSCSFCHWSWSPPPTQLRKAVTTVDTNLTIVVGLSDVSRPSAPPLTLPSRFSTVYHLPRPLPITKPHPSN